jgi:endonuclease III
MAQGLNHRNRKPPTRKGTTARTGMKASSRMAAPPTASDPARRARVRRILAALARAYPDARCALDHHGPLDLYVATVLSAQCTDQRVNQVTPALFSACRRPEDYLALGSARLEEAIRSTGFFRNKAKSILGGCRVLVTEFGGEMPGTLTDLLRLPGVGRKTANVILGEAFHTPGITVDTHVGRLARRLGFTAETDPVKVEFALMPLIPRKDWTSASHLLIWHGRECCGARKPECARCPVQADCPYPAGSAPVAG